MNLREMRVVFQFCRWKRSSQRWWRRIHRVQKYGWQHGGREVIEVYLRKLFEFNTIFHKYAEDLIDSRSEEVILLDLHTWIEFWSQFTQQIRGVHCFSEIFWINLSQNHTRWNIYWRKLFWLILFWVRRAFW